MNVTVTLEGDEALAYVKAAEAVDWELATRPHELFGVFEPPSLRDDQLKAMWVLWNKAQSQLPLGGERERHAFTERIVGHDVTSWSPKWGNLTAADGSKVIEALQHVVYFLGGIP